MTLKDSLRPSVPPHTLAGLDRYVNHRIPPGGFLRAVLENNLSESFGRADAENQRAMFHIVNYIYNCLPYDCWGSVERVRDWLSIAPEKESE